ncbi:MAG: putative Extracellular solute-binding protein family 5 [Subtercola sp.]|nr:putative Extracellular solute-binding protein family 5 [Subtercola sp.]
MNKFSRIALGAVSMLTAAALLSACTQGGGASSSSSPAAQVAGGSLTVVVTGGNGTMTTLDPIAPANPNSDMKNAIFGELFHLGANAEIQPSLATGYTVSPDGLTVTYKLRTGVTFSDGTPFNAAAVKAAYDRALNPANGCPCLSTFATIASTAAPDDSTVVVTLKKPSPAFMVSISGTAMNWIPSPTAEAAMSPADFGAKPVGAGPFTVTSFDSNQKLVLAKNPKYYDPAYLDTLTFQSIGTDQSALASIQSGQAQVVEGITTFPLFTQAKAQFDVVPTASTSVWLNQFNTISGPMSNPLARQALRYATDAQGINNAIFEGQNTIANMGVAQGLPFYQATVPGFLGYDLAKATALVTQIGGLSIEIMETTSTVGQKVAEALAAQWTKAGVKVTLVAPSLADKQAKIKAGSWDVSTAFMGSIDPAGSLGYNSFFGSGQPNSGTKDATLDTLIQSAASELDQTKRADLYKQVAQKINDNSDAGFLFSNQTFNIVSRTGVVNASQPVRWMDWAKVSVPASK